MNNNVLARAIQVVAFLFAAFGGFLGNVAPPEDANPLFAVGFASILALCVLLFVSAVVRKKQTQPRLRAIFLGAAAVLFVTAVVSGLFYNSNLNHLTIAVPPERPTERHVVGTEFTPFGQAERDKAPDKSLSEFVYDLGGVKQIEAIWVRESVNHAKTVLTVNYIVLVLGIAGTVFCLAEGILAQPEPKR
jgi:hypothetical protein